MWLLCNNKNVNVLSFVAFCISLVTKTKLKFDLQARALLLVAAKLLLAIQLLLNVQSILERKIHLKRRGLIQGDLSCCSGV